MFCTLLGQDIRERLQDQWSSGILNYPEHVISAISSQTDQSLLGIHAISLV